MGTLVLLGRTMMTVQPCDGVGYPHQLVFTDDTMTYIMPLTESQLREQQGGFNTHRHDAAYTFEYITPDQTLRFTLDRAQINRVADMLDEYVKGYHE